MINSQLYLKDTITSIDPTSFAFLTAASILLNCISVIILQKFAPMVEQGIASGVMSNAQDRRNSKGGAVRSLGSHNDLIAWLSFTHRGQSQSCYLPR